MFVMNFKLSKKRIYAVFLIAALSLLLVFASVREGRGGNDGNGYGPLEVSDGAAVCAFLQRLGWQVDADRVSQKELRLPSEFNSVYASYNELQKRQGFDLTEYRGAQADQYTVDIVNYPNYDGEVQAHVLVCNGTVIGGDIAAAELGGFMQGFDFPQSETEVSGGDETSG